MLAPTGQRQSRRQKKQESSLALKILVIFVLDGAFIWHLLSELEDDILRCRNLPHPNQPCSTEIRDVEEDVDPSMRVPNVVHYVVGLSPGAFTLANYLSVLSVVEVQKPSSIFVYFEYEPTGEWFQKARDYIVPIQISAYKSAFGAPLPDDLLRADLLGLKILRELGGILLDPNYIAQKPLDTERKAEAYIGAYGLVLASPRSAFIERWIHAFKAAESTPHFTVAVPRSLARSHGSVGWSSEGAVLNARTEAADQPGCSPIFDEARGPLNATTCGLFLVPRGLHCPELERLDPASSRGHAGTLARRLLQGRAQGKARGREDAPKSAVTPPPIRDQNDPVDPPQREPPVGGGGGAGGYKPSPLAGRNPMGQQPDDYDRMLREHEDQLKRLRDRRHKQLEEYGHDTEHPPKKKDIFSGTPPPPTPPPAAAPSPEQKQEAAADSAPKDGAAPAQQPPPATNPSPAAAPPAGGEQAPGQPAPAPAGGDQSPPSAAAPNGDQPAAAAVAAGNDAIVAAAGDQVANDGAAAAGAPQAAAVNGEDKGGDHAAGAGDEVQHEGVPQGLEQAPAEHAAEAGEGAAKGGDDEHEGGDEAAGGEEGGEGNAEGEAQGGNGAPEEGAQQEQEQQQEEHRTGHDEE